MPSPSPASPNGLVAGLCSDIALASLDLCVSWRESPPRLGATEVGHTIRIVDFTSDIFAADTGTQA